MNIKLIRFTKIHITDEYIGWLQDPEVNKYLYIGRFPVCRENIIIPAENDEKNMMFAVIVDGSFIGTCSLHKIDTINRNGEIGYMIGNRNFWGKGIGTAVVRALTDYGFNRLNLHKISAGVEEPNIGSCVALEKNGFTKIAAIPENYYSNGVYLNTIIYCKFQRDHEEKV